MRLIDLDELLNKGYPTIYHTEFGDEVINVEDLKNAPTVARTDYETKLDFWKERQVKNEQSI